MSYIWADQPERLTLTRTAASVMTAQVQRGDAIDWLARTLPQSPEGCLHLIQHTVAWQYFPKAAQARGKALIEAAGKRAARNRPLAWLSMEQDGSGLKGAALTLRLWPGDITLPLARVDFHGRWNGLTLVGTTRRFIERSDAVNSLGLRFQESVDEVASRLRAAGLPVNADGSERVSTERRVERWAGPDGGGSETYIEQTRTSVFRRGNETVFYCNFSSDNP